MAKLKIKSGDTVLVIAGDHKGQQGKVQKVFPDKNKAIVEGVNTISKHEKPSASNPQGGITKKEAPINISNLSLMTKDGKATRVGYREEDGKKVRFSKKSKIFGSMTAYPIKWLRIGFSSNLVASPLKLQFTKPNGWRI